MSNESWLPGNREYDGYHEQVMAEDRERLDGLLTICEKEGHQF